MEHIFKIALISDTHDKLAPVILDQLVGYDHIIHAGDFTSPKIMRSLQNLAPVTACRGNCDYGPWAAAIPAENVVELQGHLFLVVHNLYNLSLDPTASNISAVVYGHTHVSKQHSRNGVIYVNPGSATEPRSGQNRGFAELQIAATGLAVVFHTIPTKVTYY